MNRPTRVDPSSLKVGDVIYCPFGDSAISILTVGGLGKSAIRVEEESERYGGQVIRYYVSHSTPVFSTASDAWLEMACGFKEQAEAYKELMETSMKLVETTLEKAKQAGAPK